MGMYTMCPACKAANRPCIASNCDEVLKAISHNFNCKPHERWPIPALQYYPTAWSTIKTCGKRLIVWLMAR